MINQKQPQPKVLLVEDDSTLSMIVSETLQRDDFAVTVVANGEEGLRHYLRSGADIIVADVMMPVMDGFEMVRKIRQLDTGVPVIFLTAKSEIDDIAQGFEIGGNDYLKKPFKIRELIIRIRALLRRSAPMEESRYQIGLYTLDMNSQTVSFPDKEAVELTIIEARLLRELARNIGRTVEASTMMMLIWQRDDPYSRNSLHGFIHKLRYYLRFDPRIKIINQRGIGYMLALSDAKD